MVFSRIGLAFLGSWIGLAFIDLDQSYIVNGFLLIVLDFQSALDLLGFSGTWMLGFSGLRFRWFFRFGFGFVWILDFSLVSLRTDFSVGFGFWFLLGLVVFQDNLVFLGLDRLVIGWLLDDFKKKLIDTGS